MASRSIPGTAILIAILAAAMLEARARQREPEAVNIPDPAVETASGIRTDRLSVRQLRVWEAIQGIVFAKDASGRFSHPKLHGLWQWVEASGHVIYVELRNPRFHGDRQAGGFLVEKSRTDAQERVAVIWLSLPVIDGALVRKRIPGTNGLIRFDGLGKPQRYAEVLGHELAHAVWTLGDSDNARLAEELERAADDYHTSLRNGVHSVIGNEQARQHLNRIESLKVRIERQAETAEAEVWQELLESRGRK